MCHDVQGDIMTECQLVPVRLFSEVVVLFDLVFLPAFTTGLPTAIEPRSTRDQICPQVVTPLRNVNTAYGVHITEHARVRMLSFTRNTISLFSLTGHHPKCLGVVLGRLTETLVEYPCAPKGYT